MPAETTIDPSAIPIDVITEAPDAEATPEKKLPGLKLEVAYASSALFNSKTERVRRNLDATPSSKAIETADWFGKMTTADIGDGYDFPGPDGKDAKGNPIGNPVYITVNGEKARIVQINACDTDTLTATLQIGEGDDAGRIDNFKVNRQQIADANLLAEKDTILAGLEGDERAVAEAYFKSIDPEDNDMPEYNEELRKQVESVAEKNGMITASVIKDAVKSIYGKGAKDDVKKFLTSLEADGKTILDKADLEKAFKKLGIDKNWLSSQADNLLGQLSAEQAKLDAAIKADIDTTLFSQRVDAIKSQLALITAAAEQWRKKEEAGADPIDNYINKAIKGELDPEIIQQLRTGKLDKVMDGLFIEVTKNMSEEDQAEARSNFDKLKSGSWKTIKFGGIMLIILAAIPAAALAGATAIATANTRR